MKHLYIAIDAAGLVKIGISGALGVRMSRLGRERTSVVSLIWASPMREDAWEVEQVSHAQLDDHSRGGEWFCVTEAMAIATVCQAIERSEAREILMDDRSKVHLGIKIADDVKAALVAAAKVHRRSITAMALWIIEQWLRENGFL